MSNVIVLFVFQHCYHHSSSIWNEFDIFLKIQNCMVPHGGAESALSSISSRPCGISKLLKGHMKVLIIWHKVTKCQLHNFYDQKVVLDFRSIELILLPPCKIGLTFICFPKLYHSLHLFDYWLGRDMFLSIFQLHQAF